MHVAQDTTKEIYEAWEEGEKREHTLAVTDRLTQLPVDAYAFSASKVRRRKSPIG